MRERVAVHVERDSRRLVLSARDERTGARVTLSISVRGGACLAAQLWAATSHDSEEGHDSEAVFNGSVEVVKQ